MPFEPLFPISYFWKGKIDNISPLLEYCSDSKNLKEIKGETIGHIDWKGQCLIETYDFIDNSVLLKSLNNVFKNFGTEMLHATSALDMDIEILNSWLNVYHKNYYQETHNHIAPKSKYNHKTWSAVIFLNEGEGFSKFQFVNSLLSLRQDNLIKHVFEIEPKSSDVIIFPCETLHQVTPHKSSEKRMTIAFNFVLETKYEHE